MIFGIFVLVLLQIGAGVDYFGVGIFYDLSEWSNKVLPSAGNVNLIDSTADLIPYQYYFDGNEIYNITAKVCDVPERDFIGIIVFTSCKKAAFLRPQINSLYLLNVIVTADGDPCDLSLSSSSSQSLMAYPDCRLLNEAFVSIASHKSWRSINFIYDESYGQLCMNALAEQFSSLSISLATIYVSEDNGVESSLSSLNNENDTRIFVVLNSNRTMALVKQASKLLMFRRHFYWAIYTNSNFTTSEDLISDLDSGHVLTLFFNMNFSDFIVEDIISAFGHSLESMINQNGTYSSGKYNCYDKNLTPLGAELLQILTKNLTNGPKWTSDGVLDLTVHIQSTATGKNGALTEVATYNNTDRFHVFNNRLYLNLFNDFGNRTLTVVSWTSTPFTMRVQTRNNQTYYRGLCYDILDEFAKVFNFRYVIKDSIDGTYGGPTGDGRNGTGMVGMVMRGEADIGVGPFTVTAARETVVDFLTPFQEEGVGIIMRTVEQKTNRMFRMFLPFQSTSWIATGVSIVITGVILCVVSRFSPYTRDSDKPFYTNVWLAFGAFFGQLGGDTTPTSASGRLVLGIWWMCTILILELYTANLAAFLTIPPAKSPIKNLEELAASPDYKPVVKSGSNLEFLFKRAKGGLYKQIWDRMDNMPIITTTEEGYELVHKGQYAYMTDVSQLTYKVLTDCHNLLVSEETFNKAGLSFIVRENAEFKSAFNFHMIRMIEAGLIAKFHSKWWPKLSECGDDSTQTATELHIDGMAGIFIVYAAFTGLATLFFVTEIILYRIIHRQKEIKIKSADTVD